MADDKNNSDEPSIEEILSSIREIISEDDDDSAPAAKSEEPAPAEDKAVVKEDNDDDVLDLGAFAEEGETEAVRPEVETADPLADIDLGHSAGDEIDMVDAPEEDIEEEDDDDIDGLADILGVTNDEDDEVEIEIEEPTAPLEEEKVVVKEETEVDAEEKGALIDKVAEGATISAMAKLTENISLSRSHDGVTLEDIVRELLRPMLKDWLDDNLPDLIERLVSQELERLAQKAARK